MSKKPQFTVKENLQKSKQTGVYFSDVVTPEVLSDVAEKITGVAECEVKYVANDYSDNFLSTGYNRGRMAVMEYEGEVSYVSFSEQSIGGRNSSVQSVPTAYNLFYMNEYNKKKLYYYFLNYEGSASTDYQLLIYRLMKTIGFTFLNEDAIDVDIEPFQSIDDIMNNRKVNASRNKSNNSTYITKSSANQYDVYGKTYGANKYETSLMCYALSALKQDHQNITLYEVSEKDLKALPQSSRDVLDKMGNIEIVPSSLQLEKNSFDKEDSLRSPRYIYNLLERLGPKKCALCNCEIPELIQGAHVYPVSAIKKNGRLSIEEKLSHATDGNNGIWLCQNHHKLFDEGFIGIDFNGTVVYRDNLEAKYLKYLDEVTINPQLDKYYLSDEFKSYLKWRNAA